MRKSILLALVAALALTIGLSSLAAAGQGGAETSAKRAHKKGKKKGKRCKSKGKKGKRKGRGCKGGAKGALPLRTGMYEGQDGIGLNVTAGGKMAALTVNAPPDTCLPVPLELPDERATSTAKRFKAGGKPVTVLGGSGEITWVIEVNQQLHYKLRLDSSYSLPEQPPCDKPGRIFNGKLKKTA